MVKKLRQTRRKKGGALNCEAEGFTLNIREASFGRNYPNAIVSHDNSEQWTYEELVDTSKRGLVGWYCKQAKLSSEECTVITSLPEVQALGAFFHRYKVFIEHIGKAKRKLKLNNFFKSQNLLASFITKVTEKPNLGYNRELLRCWRIIEPNLLGNADYEKFRTADLSIELTIDRVQCLLWVIVKNKGLPKGFIMDERITKRAQTPIILGNPYYFPEALFRSPVIPGPAILQVAKLMEIVYADRDELSEPPVSFGVY